MNNDQSAAADAQLRRQALGRVLREVRGDLTRQEMAERVGIDETQIAAWEEGTDVPPTLEEAFELEVAVGADPGVLAVVGGYVGESANARAGRDVEPVQVLFYSTLQEVFDGLRAAEALELYVRVLNSMSVAEGSPLDLWQLELYAEPLTDI